MIGQYLKYYKNRFKKDFSHLGYSILYFSGILSHRTHIEWEKEKHIECQDNEIKPIYVGANTLYFIHTSTLTGYFRPVLRHLSYTKCVFNAVDEYFLNIHPEQKIEYECVKEALSNRKTRRRFFNMGSFNDPYSLARRFYLTKETIYVGIKTPVDLIRGSEKWKCFIRNIHSLLKYVKNAMNRHRRNCWCGEWEYSGLNRQMATETVATVLGLNYLFPHSELLVVSFRDITMFGTIMQVSKGNDTSALSVDESRLVASPNLQRDLIALNLMDTITFERDHRPGNYNIILNNSGKVTAISVFDNDAIMTFAPFPAKFQSCAGSSSIIKKNGINRPYLPKELVERLLELPVKELKMALHPYLNYIQIIACCKRLRTLKRILNKDLKKKDMLLKTKEWNEKTMQEELSGCYGQTYLYTFINWENLNRAFNEYSHNADI